MMKKGKTRRGLYWTPLTLSEFRAYISICLFMGEEIAIHALLLVYKESFAALPSDFTTYDQG
jgi:hypothetical protein